MKLNLYDIESRPDRYQPPTHDEKIFYLRQSERDALVEVVKASQSYMSQAHYGSMPEKEKRLRKALSVFDDNAAY